MKKLTKWEISCNHSPEMIDRIVLPIRKRGLSIDALAYNKGNNGIANCTLEVELEETEIERVHKNMVRLYDVITIQRIS